MLNIRHRSFEEIEKFILENKHPKYRAKQIFEWLWKNPVGSIDDMNNISKELRELLKTHFFIPNVSLASIQKSTDKTIKTKFILHDQYAVEGVLIPAPNRVTGCISSQVGCSLSCNFCATGKMDRKRNLTYDEIVNEVTLLNDLSIENYGRGLSNLVYMGMGEPLLNYANVMKSVEMLSSVDGMNMSPRRMTISTAGIAKMIQKMGDDDIKANLALSLHAPNDKKRSQLMPINETNNLASLIEAMDYYFAKTKRHITFEYVMLKGFNDTEKDALELIKIVRRIPSKVNLIEYNTIGDGLFEKSDEKHTLQFMHLLEQNNVTAKLRRSRGKDIDAACGQLANK